MIIVGCDYHPGFQQISYVDTETREVQEQRLPQREEAERFYRDLAARKATVRVGMEASGHGRWFERRRSVFANSAGAVRWGLKLAERGGRNGKKRAIVATARKLAVLLHHLWVSGEVYEPLHNSNRMTAAAAA